MRAARDALYRALLINYHAKRARATRKIRDYALWAALRASLGDYSMKRKALFGNTAVNLPSRARQAPGSACVGYTGSVGTWRFYGNAAWINIYSASFGYLNIE